MQPALQACRDLLAATEALARAIHEPDPESLAAAVERRDVSFCRVEELVQGEPGPAERELLVRVQALDRRIQASARAAQEEVRRELDAIATARRAARVLQAQSPPEPPRFVAKRA